MVEGLARLVGLAVAVAVMVIAPFSTIARTSNGWLCSGFTFAPGVVLVMTS